MARTNRQRMRSRGAAPDPDARATIAAYAASPPAVVATHTPRKRSTSGRLTGGNPIEDRHEYRHVIYEISDSARQARAEAIRLRAEEAVELINRRKLNSIELAELHEKNSEKLAALKTQLKASLEPQLIALREQARIRTEQRAEQRKAQRDVDQQKRAAARLEARRRELMERQRLVRQQRERRLNQRLAAGAVKQVSAAPGGFFGAFEDGIVHLPTPSGLSGIVSAILVLLVALVRVQGAHETRFSLFLETLAGLKRVRGAGEWQEYHNATGSAVSTQDTGQAQSPNIVTTPSGDQSANLVTQALDSQQTYPPIPVYSGALPDALMHMSPDQIPAAWIPPSATIGAIG